MESLLCIFLILALGFAAGQIKIKEISLGTSAILLVALVFGHFGFELPAILKNVGLSLFVSAVGFAAAPGFRKMSKKIASCFFLGFLITFIALLCCVSFAIIFKIPSALATGIFTGAVTSTPGLAMALEVTGDTSASVGYGIAYPFGAVGLVLSAQIVPKILSAGKYQRSSEEAVSRRKEQLKSLDERGLVIFFLAIVLGVLIGRFNIVIGGTPINLGVSGGALISGILVGNILQIGNVSLSVPKATINTMREIGLALFLMSAGVEAGSGFVETFNTWGFLLFAMGAVITLFPSAIGFVVAHKLFGFSIYDSLGAVYGGMTSTPSLGTLIAVAEDDYVSTYYAAAYPAALIAVMLSSVIIPMLVG